MQELVPAERVDAHLAAHRLVAAAQDDPAPSAAEVEALIELADRRGWPEVSVRARVARGMLAIRAGRVPLDVADEICRLAERGGDPAVLAGALAFRSSLVVSVGHQPMTSAAEADLAVAVVLLEQEQGDPLERTAAHVACGITFRGLDLWERALAHCQAAARIDPIAEEPALAAHAAELAALRHAIEYNMVDLETNYACALFVAGEIEQALAHGAAARHRYAQIAAAGDWQPGWLADLAACVLLVRALAGEDVSAQASAVADDDDASPHQVGYALVALALSLIRADPVTARRRAEEAVDVLGVVDMAPVLTLAMELSADLEAAPAGRRAAKAQMADVWASHRRDADAMEGLIDAERLRARSRELERHAHLDDLTGLANRRGFSRYLETLVSRGHRRLSLLVVDLDRFKAVNDRYGHPTGDEVLQQVARVLGSLVRSSDLAARLGGDEFLVVLDDVTTAEAVRRAETIVRVLAEAGFGPAATPISVSVGVATGPPALFDRILLAADGALYRGKASGRRVVAAPQELAE